MQPPASTPRHFGAAIALDTSAAPVGGTVTVNGTGFVADGFGMGLFINLEPVAPGGNLRSAMGIDMPHDGTDQIRSADDGTFSVAVSVPAGAQTGLQQICALPQRIGVRNYICAPFTVLDGGAVPTTTPSTNPADGAPINPSAIVGRYQCSKIGINSPPILACNSGISSTFEPLFVIAADGTYEWGDEFGTYSIDGSTITFSGGETGRVLNRRLDLQVAGDDGNNYVWQYTRMGNSGTYKSRRVLGI